MRNEMNFDVKLKIKNNMIENFTIISQDIEKEEEILKDNDLVN
jgi:hypothetical protein